MSQCSPASETLYGLLGKIDDALSQAQDCLRGETPEDMTDEEARTDTINKVREAMRITDQLRSTQPAASADEIERLQTENWQLRQACGYSIPADKETPQNPFKCGICDARSSAGIDSARDLQSYLDANAAQNDGPVQLNISFNELKKLRSALRTWAAGPGGVAQPSREFPYQQTFDAIASAVSLYPDKHDPSGISISVRKFQEAFNSHRDAKASPIPSTEGK